MNLFADEGLERQIVERLRRDGHQVAWIAELAPSVTDEEVLRFASESDSVLVTEDKDFGELVYRRRLSHAGVLLVRLDGLPNTDKAEVVALAIRTHGQELRDAFAVVTADAVRIRRPFSADRTPDQGKTRADGDSDDAKS